MGSGNRGSNLVLKGVRLPNPKPQTPTRRTSCSSSTQMSSHTNTSPSAQSSTTPCPTIHHRPPIQRETPPIIHERPPILHQKPPILHQTPPTLHQRPPVLHHQRPHMHAPGTCGRAESRRDAGCTVFLVLSRSASLWPRLFSSENAGVLVQVHRRLSGNEPGLTVLVSTNGLLDPRDLKTALCCISF